MKSLKVGMILKSKIKPLKPQSKYAQIELMGYLAIEVEDCSVEDRWKVKLANGRETVMIEESILELYR